MRSLITVLLLLFAFFSCGSDTVIEDEIPIEDNPTGTSRVLVFTRTEGFRHSSIANGITLFKNLGTANDFEVLTSENSTFFTSTNLATIDLVVFLSTTGDILNEEQQNTFEAYIKNGGSFIGVHAATDTEYNWPWYGKLVGAYFKNHPSIQEVTINVVDKIHVSSTDLPDQWVRTDEWYNFRDINPDINVLLKLDESTYTGGENGEDHPIAWYHEFDGGRVFYTGGGHTKESYEEESFKKHLLGGILYCLGR